MKKFCLVGILAMTGLLIAVGMAPAQIRGLSFSIEQEFWATEMERSGDEVILHMLPQEAFQGWDLDPVDERIVLYDVIQRANFNRTFLRISLPLADRMTFYAKAGISRLYPELKWMRAGEWERYYEDWGDTEPYAEEGYEYEGTLFWHGYFWMPMELGYKESSSGTAYGAGLDFVLSSSPTCSAILNLEYLSEEDKDVGSFRLEWYETWENLGGEEAIERLGWTHDKANTTQMSASIIGRANIGRFHPYAGVRYCSVETKYTGTGTYYLLYTSEEDEETWPTDFEYTVNSVHNLGFLGGASFEFNDSWTGRIGVICQGDWGVSAGVEKRL